MISIHSLKTGNTIGYDYNKMEKDLLEIKRNYKFIKINTIGNSVEGRNIYSFKIGSGNEKVLICSGTHSSEWITTPALLKWIYQICKFYTLDKELYKINIRKVLSETSIHVVPMLNPDGINLQINGIEKSNKYYEKLLKWNNNSLDFTKWKSNIQGVDLNRNFNAKWDLARDIQTKNMIIGPGPSMYGGEFKESEPETKALVNYTKDINPNRVISLHTQGEEIYWQFENIKVKEAYNMAKQMSKVSGYLVAEPDISSSYAGYKDWFIKEFKKPGYTIECGLGENPLPITQFNNIYTKIFQILSVGCLGYRRL